MNSTKKLLFYSMILVLLCFSFKGFAIRDKLTINPKENQTEGSISLKSWIGDYSFTEYSPPDQNMFYSITIYPKNNNYYARISIDGFQTMERLLAKVSGDLNSIKLVFYKYLPDNDYEAYKENEVLLRFEKRNSKIYTFWGKIQPMLDKNKSGKEYFKIK